MSVCDPWRDVFDGVTSAHSRRAYEVALHGFLSWWESADHPPNVADVSILDARVPLIVAGNLAAALGLAAAKLPIKTRFISRHRTMNTRLKNLRDTSL